MKPLDFLPLYEDAAFYDAEFATRDHELPFYRRLALEAGGPVLELCCGTGRITLPLAEAGVDITGVDVAPAMIARARERAAAARLEVPFHLADIRTLALPGPARRFRLAFIATNALQHLHDLDSIAAFFERAAAHLEPGGRLVLDVFNPSVKKLARTADQPYLFKRFALADGRTVEVEAASEYLPATQLLHFTLRYRHRGELLLAKDVRMRCFFPDELLALCRLGGFEVLERLGDYDRRPFDDSAPRQLLVCRPALTSPRLAPPRRRRRRTARPSGGTR